MKIKSVLVFSIMAGLFISCAVCFASENKRTVPTSFVYQAIDKYKNGNYTGCIQDMDYLIGKGSANDVAYYYKAMSYARIGVKDEARNYYQTAIDISSDPTLIDYATHAIECIDDSSKCTSSLDTNDISSFINSSDFMHEDVKKVTRKQETERAKQEINADVRPNIDKQYLNMNDTNMPSDKEIADAVKTLAKVGINPFQGYNQNLYGANNEYAQISALLGSNNNSSNTPDLLPFILQSGSNSNINKDFIQSYMTSQMLPNFSFTSNDK